MLKHYLVLALRALRRAPGTAAINVLTLALGLVAAVTAYSFVAFTERADAHFADSDRIYLLRMKMTPSDGAFKGEFGVGGSEQAAEFLAADFPDLEMLARAIDIDRKLMVAGGGNAVRLYGVAVDREFFDFFPLPLVAGGDAHTALAAPRSVVLTQEQARALFGDRNPVGEAVVLANAVDATVTGVLAPVREPSHLGRTQLARLPFDMLTSVDVVEAVRVATLPPRTVQAMKTSTFFGGGAITYLRLPPKGLTSEALNARMRDFAARHMPAETLQRMNYEFDVTPLRGLLSSRRFMSTGIEFGTMLLSLGGLVLAVAGVNYANLATARATRRAREIGVRKALGAPPRQIMAQTLLEAGLLTALALVLAVALFFLARPVIRDLFEVDLAATFLDDPLVWPFFAALAVAVTLAAGFYPAFVLSRVQPATAIASPNVRLGSRFFSLMLVGSQFAIASFLVLVVTIVSMQNAEFARSGFGAAEDPLVVIENPTRVTKVEPTTLRAELTRIPQVRGVTEVEGVPWEMTMITVVTASPDPGAAKRNVTTRPVGEGFFSVFDVPLVAGRLLGSEHAGDLPPPAAAPADGQDSSQPAAPPARLPDSNIVVDRTFAKALGFASSEAAVGQTVYRPVSALGGTREPSAMHIVGVVEDRLFTFFNWNQMGENGAFYTLRPSTEYTVARVARDDLTAGIAAIDAMWKALAPNVAVTRRFLDDVFNTSYEYYVRIGKLFAVLASMAFVISVAGLFAMATLVVARRRQEVGVRKALGARTPQIVALLLSGFGKPVVIANLVAWPAAFVAARIYLKPFLNPIPLTPLPFVGSLALMLAIACLAVGTQTWRAARLKPAEVLRDE